MITVKELSDLRALLATMRSAKDQRVNMSVWDRDINAVANAIAIFEAIRAAQQLTDRK